MTERYAAIWDMDGTLVDTAELHFEAWQRMSAELGRQFTRDDFAATFGRRNPEIVKYLYGDHITEADGKRIAETKEGYYMEMARNGVDLLPGVRSLLEGFHAIDWAQGIGSSAPRANLELILDLTKSRGFFQTVIAMEDTTRGKPEPEVFLNAAKKLGVPPERCVVFEDAVAGVQAAKAAGMKCVAVRFVAHHSEEKLMAAGADLCVGRLDEIGVERVKRMFKAD